MTQKLNIITIDGAIYLGNLKQEVSKDNTILTVENALPLGQVADITKQHLVAYIESENLGKLQKPITIGGNVSYSSCDLSDDLEMELSILYMKLKQAQNNAPKKLVNTEFKTLAGG